MGRTSLSSTIALIAVALCSCDPSARSESEDWAGTIDTLPSGQIVVANTKDPIWPPGEEWQVIEELRIGTLEGTGPDLFGRIISLEVDPAGRMYVFESQSQELRVFKEDGTHLRTIGRKGGGPGEFARAVMVELGPDGNLWVPDPENNRISVFDTAGALLYSRPAPGGFIIIPWPGGFDDNGYYYSPIFVPAEPGSDLPFHVALARFDRDLQPVDTIVPPSDPHDPSKRRFEIRSEDGGFAAASIPFTGTFRWRLHRSGTLWALLGGEYRLFEIDSAGDTLRSITRDYIPIPVTEDDVDDAMESLEWFVREGGKVDRSRIPSTMPAASGFFFDDVNNLWVRRVTTAQDRTDRVDVFDPSGGYMGEIQLPFVLTSLAPVIRNSTIWAVTTDELDVPYVVRAKIVKPAAETSTLRQAG